jgi:uncharacterized protein (TIGR02284 family)
MFGKNDEISVLDTLTTTLIDSINGYRDSAANLEGGEQFQQMFREMADERSQVAEDLRADIRRLGGDPPDEGSLMGKTHQRFLDLKAAITGRDDKAIINEVERGEDYLKEKFETALASDELSPETRGAIEKAFQSVRKGHDKVSQLKHAMEL